MNAPIRYAVLVILALGCLGTPCAEAQLKPRLPSPTVPKRPIPSKALKVAPRHQISMASQILGSEPRVQVLSKQAIPKRYQVRVIQWGGENLDWDLRRVKSRNKNSITARLPGALYSSVKHLPGRFEVGLFDPNNDRLVSNKVPLRPARGRRVHLSAIKVYAKEVLAGTIQVHANGTNLLPSKERRLEYRVFLPIRNGATMAANPPTTTKRVQSVPATRLEVWDSGKLESGKLTFHAPQPAFSPIIKEATQERRAYDERVRSRAYVELRVLSPNGKPLSQAYRVSANRWHFSDPPKPVTKVDRDRDGYASIATGGDDCDDNNANRYPGNPEIPDDGNDEDCDPETIGDLDRDGDGYIDIRLSNARHYPNHGKFGTDCNDRDGNVHPHQGESCNGIDDNCNDRVDENLIGCNQ